MLYQLTDYKEGTMSGHSKWHSIKHKKASADAKRSSIFTKLIKEITIAARLGGGDADGNPRLRLAIQKAKDNNMPNDNISRAIKKGTGELPGVTYEEACYEGYGPGGVAVLIETMTDNKNRTVSDLRRIFSKQGGNMGESGCVSWMFHKKGLICVDLNQIDEDELMNIALEAGAEDMNKEESGYEIITSPDDFEAIRNALQKKGIPFTLAEITMLPQTTIKLEGKVAQQMLQLMEKLEEHDDVQQVYGNFDIPDLELE
jgi:YebC/PmpR family DNA-binding regulatory protein